MSRLAQNWVSSNFQLPQPINNLEKDFCNGYLFIKMLEQRNVLHRDDVDGAENGDTPQVIMKNIAILGRGLKSINIQLTKHLVADVCIYIKMDMHCNIPCNRSFPNSQGGLRN